MKQTSSVGHQREACEEGDAQISSRVVSSGKRAAGNTASGRERLKFERLSENLPPFWVWSGLQSYRLRRPHGRPEEDRPKAITSAAISHSELNIRRADIA